MARHYSTRRYNGPHRMTPARRAALRKAQLASAKKRRRRGIKVGVTVAGVGITGTLVARHKYSGSHFNVSKMNVHSRQAAHLTDKAKVPGWRKQYTPGELKSYGGHRPPSNPKSRYYKNVGKRNTREGAIVGVRHTSKKGTRRVVTYTHHKFDRKHIMGQKTRDLADWNKHKARRVSLNKAPEYQPKSQAHWSVRGDNKPLSPKYGNAAVAAGGKRVPLLGNYSRGQKGNHS